MTSYEKQDYNFESMAMFDEAHGLPNIDLLQGITNYGFEKPSQIQHETIEHLYNGRNVIGQAQSGCGKTGAFVIGSLSLLEKAKNVVQVIIIANTHELASQIYEVVCKIGSKCLLNNNDSVELCIGRQVSIEQNINNIRKGRQILVGTPGRIKHLVYHMINGKHMINPADVKVLVLDEADCLLTDKFQNITIDIVDELDDPRFRKDHLQLAIFSATFSPNSLEVARRLCVPNKNELEDWTTHPLAPVEILIPVDKLTLEAIQQYYYMLDCNPRESFDRKVDFIMALNSMIKMIPMCIIYVNSKDIADKLKNKLEREGLVCECIYGSMSDTQRQHITKSFRNCETRMLISTDLLGRGFDVQQVELVINYDVPYVIDRNTGDINKEKMAEYLHRIGRGGRYGRRGMAINLISGAGEKARLEAIEEFYHTKIEVFPDDPSDLY